MVEGPELHAVWKYELNKQSNGLEMPVGSRILNVGLQLGRICLWAQVPRLQRLMELRSVHLLGTGMQWASSEDIVYIGTIITGPPTNLVWHAYEYTGEASRAEIEKRLKERDDDARGRTEGAAGAA